MEIEHDEDELTPLHTANLILFLAESAKKKITPMQLNKLTYFSYAWCLHKLGKKIFNEKIEAWKFGPVIPSLYHEFKRFGSSAIEEHGVSVNYTDVDTIGNLEIPVLGPEHREIAKVVMSVFEHYKDYSASQMSNITHKNGSPWSIARAKEGYNTPLEDADILKRCKKLLKNETT
ncbi:MAG: type II toxin-antitoxin system antitoxin SocA domain-containing protein [Pseudomonadota bacterium]